MTQDGNIIGRERSFGLNSNQVRGEWVLKQTLVLLRWLAIIGQSFTLIVCIVYLELLVNIWACIAAIGILAVYNLYLSFVTQRGARLTSKEALTSLSIDLTQLLFMLYLTGGLSNPFALLLLAPVTISATTLRVRATMFLVAVAVVGITLLAYLSAPMKFSDGRLIELSAIQTWGIWFSLTFGFVFLSAYARRVTLEIYSMSEALSATQMALEREHKLTLLGGVVSAAAHEMGTPLATIKMAATELEEELHDKAELQDDAKLIKEQAVRLSEILKDMGQTGKEDLHVKSAPFPSVVQEAAAPHENRGKKVLLLAKGKKEIAKLKSIPTIPRRPEIIHGLRNLIQNAVDFSEKTVCIDIDWNDQELRVHISDDGPGFPYELTGLLGDPLSRRLRPGSRSLRPEYEGMGLGLFIAKTLLERSGATLEFFNDIRNLKSEVKHLDGANVRVSWPLSAFEQNTDIGNKNPKISL